MTLLAPSVRGVNPFARAQTSGAGHTAGELARLLYEAVRHEQSRATDWRPIVRAEIEQLAAECSVPNWDGYGASAVSIKAKKNAQRLVDLLPADLPEPQVVPDPDGHVSLCWDFGRDHVLTISVGETETANYAGILGKYVKRHGQESFREDAPRTLVDSIREVAAVG